MFRIDGKFFEIISRLGDLIILNIIFLICCIPIITVGASVTAMYAVTKKMAQNRESYLVRSYFRAFKENFRQSTIMWIILGGLFIISALDFYVVQNAMEGMMQACFMMLGMLVFILLTFVTIYALTLQCTFENTIKNTMKNALLLSIGHAPMSILITILTLSPFIAIVALQKYAGIILLGMICLWFSGTAYLNSFLLNRIYRRYM